MPLILALLLAQAGSWDETAQRLERRRLRRAPRAQRTRFLRLIGGLQPRRKEDRHRLLGQDYARLDGRRRNPARRALGRHLRLPRCRVAPGATTRIPGGSASEPPVLPPGGRPTPRLVRALRNACARPRTSEGQIQLEMSAFEPSRNVRWNGARSERSGLVGLRGILTIATS